MARTTIEPMLANPFSLERAGRVELSLFDLTGQRVATPASGPFPAGGHTVRWDGTHANGRQVATGLYLVRLRVADRRLSTRLVLLQ
ncbi:MAG TPA: hypothetical protein DIC52_11830 [Candidatus Latescibacteria bacterium]|nr:hypothetical protein [Candidatus Latescibacterota bacterium]